MKRLLFIYNPRAGKGKIKTRLLDILGVLSEAYEVTAYPTKGRGDAARAVREKRSYYEMIVCSGGDGTLDEVVTGMMACPKKVPIGYIPAGSTNDFAASLGLPKNMIRSARVVVDGRPFRCDVGAFNADTFVYVAAFGMFTDVSYETPQSFKNMFGHMAYILEGMKRLPSLRTYRLEVAWGEDRMEDEFLFGMITNSTSVGGLKKLTGRYVALNDGLFEMTLIRKPKNALELNQIMTALMTESMDAECIVYVKADRIRFVSKEPVAWTLDGEFGGEHTLAEIVSRPREIEIMVPDQERRR